MNIGDWVRRPPRGKFHLVESVVAGDVITRCGRRMADDNPFEVRDVMPLTRLIGQPQLCKAGCDRPGMVVFNNEDDASTQPVETLP